jgi:hypothetical protein
MKISSKLTENYVPESIGNRGKGNRELPEGERISIDLKFPSDEEFEAIRGEPTAILKLCVTRIANLEVGSKKVETGKDLVACPRRDVLYLTKELYLYLVLQSSIDTDTEKN